MATNTIAIVGASLAGLRLAQALRRHGAEHKIIAIGDEAHPPYDRPPLSKQFLTASEEPPAPTLLRDADDALDIEWRLGVRATALDLHAREITIHTGERVRFDACAIATGAHARCIPLPHPHEGVFVLRTLDDARALRRALAGRPRVAVVGGGFIGAEVAASCRARGLEVTMVEALPAPLMRALGPRMGAYFAGLYADGGVALRLGVGVREFLGARRAEGLRLADGSVVAADVVVVGVGAAPNTRWLEGSGLALADGVLCDASCRTTRAPFVVAAGDVARWPNARFPDGDAGAGGNARGGASASETTSAGAGGGTMRVEHWTNATEMADHAALALLAGEDRLVPPFAPVPFVWSEQFGCRLQVAGRVGDDCESALVDGSLDARRFAMIFGQRGKLCGVLGVNRARLVMKYRGMIRDGTSWDDARKVADD